MTISDDLAQVIHEKFNDARGRNGVDAHLLADLILASDLIRKICADALREAADLMLNAEVGLPFDDDQDIAIPSAWLMEVADRIEGSDA